MTKKDEKVFSEAEVLKVVAKIGKTFEFLLQGIVQNALDGVTIATQMQHLTPIIKQEAKKTGKTLKPKACDKKKFAKKSR